MNKQVFIKDMVAGLTVSFAALALGAAFGTMSGRGAFAGMIAAGIIPVFTGIFGGTKLSVSGPTAPMTAVSALIVAFAYDSFPGNKILAEQFITLVFLLTGLCLALAGIFRLGVFIRKVPQVVILGFMSGIALLIWIDQLKTLFGLGGKQLLQGDLVINVSLVIATLTMIFLLPPLMKKMNIPKSFRLLVPYTLVTIIGMTVISHLFRLNVQTVELGNGGHSLSEFFSILLSYLPSGEILNGEYLMMALPYALQLTLLGYLDSLLTALVMDFMTKDQSNLNRELVGQGLANAASAIFMGIPGAQATIRSVLLFKEGATTRFAAVMTGVFALLGFLLFMDYVSLIASAVFVGVLFKAGWDVFEREFIKYYFKNKWYLSGKRNIQLGFLLYTMIITVVVDLNVAVISGTVLFYIGKKMFNLEDVSATISEEAAKEKAARKKQVDRNVLMEDMAA